MSERDPGTTPPEQTPHPDAAQGAEDLDAAFAQASESSPDTPEESHAREVITGSEELQEATDTEATLRIKALNGLDRAQRNARLLSAREWRHTGRVSKLEKKLSMTEPGSRKHMRIETKLIRSRWKKDITAHKQEKIFSRMQYRSGDYGKETQKIEQMERNRDKWLIDRKVATEKKRRRKIESKYKRELEKTDPSIREKTYRELRSNPNLRDRLKKEIDSWTGNTIQKYKADLVAEAEKKYTNR